MAPQTSLAAASSGQTSEPHPETLRSSAWSYRSVSPAAERIPSMPRRDTSVPRRHLIGVLAAAMLFVTAGSAFAQALDTPSLKLNRAGFFRIDIDVQAGASGTPNGFTIQ